MLLHFAMLQNTKFQISTCGMLCFIVTILGRVQASRRSRSRSFSPPRRQPSPGRRRRDGDEPTRPVSYLARPKDSEEKASEPAPAKKKKEDNPLLMKTGAVRMYVHMVESVNVDT